jgi:hypothetical protein
LKKDVVWRIDDVIVDILAVQKLTRASDIVNLTQTLFHRRCIGGVRHKIAYIMMPPLIPRRYTSHRKTDIVWRIDGVIVGILAVQKLTGERDLVNHAPLLFHRHCIGGVPQRQNCGESFFDIAASTEIYWQSNADAKKNIFLKSFSKTSSAEISENRHYTVDVTPMLPACLHRLDGINQIGPWEVHPKLHWASERRNELQIGLACF